MLPLMIAHLSPLCLPVLLAVAPAGPARQETPAQEAPAPRLVVLVSTGPLNADQLDGLEPWLEGGLARLRREGFTYAATELDYAATELSPGAATLSTGLSPRRHGIVGDSFLDRESGLQRFSTHDTDTMQLAPGGVIRQPTPGGDSPEHLLAHGVADHLRAAHPGARTVSIGGDARLAVLLAGRQPDRALWWDRRAGGFTSSTWYGPELPAWVLAWNETWAERASGEVWQPLVEGSLAAAGFGPDERRGEAPRPGGAQLPLQLPTLAEKPAPIEYQALAAVVMSSPWMDRFSIELATRALEELELGADDEPDLLCLGLSATATQSQLSGPYSRETAETLLSVDRELGAFFELLDERVGKGRWIAALAGSGGMMPLSNVLRAEGIGARRMLSNNTRRTLALVRDELTGRYGSFFGVGLPGPVMTIDGAAMAAAEVDAREVRRVACDMLLSAGDWIAGAYTLEELQGLEGDEEDPWLALYRRSFSPQRAPDIVVRATPWTVVNVRHGTASGSLYPYDRRTVLTFMGPGIEPGRSYERVHTEDLLPTLLTQLGMSVPEELEGRALSLTRD